MGEKKLKEWLSFKDLIEKYGLSESYFYKNSKLFEPALLKIAGRAPKPYRYSAEIIEQIITTGGAAKTAPTKTVINRSRLKTKKSKVDPNPGDDDLWR